VVIVSHPDRADRKPEIEVVACASQRANRQPKADEALLDSADGLDWETVCFGNMIYSLDRAQLGRKRGEVTAYRRGTIVRAILAGHGWAAEL
jgi:hypothetical protein